MKNDPPTAAPSMLPALESVLCTEELDRRPSRPPDYERESRALVSLAQALADSPRTILQTLADTILKAFQCDSGGVSLVTADGKRFHWPAIAGQWKPHIGGGTPRDFGPCGDVLDRNCPLLFRHFERRYTYFLPVTPPVEECLLVPFYVEGKAVGTIWAIAHDDRRKFDSEDMRMLVSLGTFASAAYQAVGQLHAITEHADKGREASQTLREMNAALMVSSVHLQELTERAQMAEVAAAHLAAIVTASDDAIISMDLQGNIRSWNKGAQHLFGHMAEEVIGRLGTLLIPPDRVDEESEILERIGRGEAIDNYETVRQRKDGSLIDVSLTVSSIKDAQHRITGASKIARDITERKQAQNTIRDREHELRLTTDNAPVLIAHCDGERRYKFVNKQYAETFGLTPAEIVGKHMAEILGEQFYADVKPHVDAVLTGQHVEFEQELPRKERHQPQMARVAYEPERDAAGGVVGFVAAIIDNTEHKLAEKALHESHARFEALFDASPVSMYLVDAELRIRLVSQKARPVFGDIGELIGRDFVEVIHILWPPASADEIVARFRHTLETGEPYSAPEFSEERYDRKVREYYDWQIQRIALPDGQYGVVCYFMDISERMRLSDELRQYAANLSESDHRKNEFLAMLAHELRNPLAPIRNALQIMRLTGGNGQAVTSASEMMERQVGQMVRLVDDLLDVSRISRGKIELRRERIELASLIYHAAESCRPAMESANHELTVTLPPRPSYLNADPTRLAQVVGNLLNNACKFTERGGRIWLTVELEGEEAVIRVRDSGIGIAADQLPRIFEMFTQIDTSLDRSGGGLGIGLALVKNLVEMHGGTVEVHSAGVGQGSEFVVRLPIMVDAPKPPPPEPTACESTHTTARRILVVDDNRDAATSLAMLLKMTGHETHTAYDGLEALEAAEMFRPEVVLLDIGLPKLNGYEVARKIREQPWSQDMVLVALTGWGQDEDRRKSKEAGFNGHLVKPIDHAALIKILAELKQTTE